MHDFGDIDLVGKHAIFKAKRFCKKKATVRERTFVCKSGYGCKSMPNSGRKITGHWLSDNTPDTISSYDLESIIINGKAVEPKESAYIEVCDVSPEPAKVAKEVRRKKT